MGNEAESTLNKIFEPINERLKGPFTGAFFISWLIVNWKVIIVILTFDYSKEVKILFKQLEDDYSNSWSLLGCPLLLSVLYILVAPLSASISYTIKEFFKKHIKERFEIILNKSKPISPEKYSKVIDELLIIKKELANIKLSEKELSNEQTRHETIIKKFEVENKILKEANTKAMKENFYGFFDGVWELDWGKDKEYLMFDKDEEIYYWSPAIDGEYNPVFWLKGIFIDETQKTVQFTKEDIKEQTGSNSGGFRVLFNDLEISDDKNGVVAWGKENIKTNVTYRKVR